MISLQSLAEALEGAERALKDAKIAEREAHGRYLRAGVDAFTAALAAQGITKGTKIVIEGKYSGGWTGQVRNMKHDATPVILRSWIVDSAPWTNPPANSTANKWWFRLLISRMKKDGTARDEYRNTLVYGLTPELAAQQVVRATGGDDA